MAHVTEIDVKDASNVSRQVATLDALNALVGEVQASPTTNTVLERLKVLNTSLAAINALLTTQAGYLDGVEAGLASILTTTVLAAGTNAIGKLAAGEAHLGSVGGDGTVFDITLTTDTAAYADGDTLADRQILTSVARVSGGMVYLQTVVVQDLDDQGIGLDLLFFNADTQLGTENSAPDIDDTEVLTCLGYVRINASDFVDLGANRIATLRNVGLALKTSGSANLYIAAITRGAPTYASGTIPVKLGFLRD